MDHMNKCLYQFVGIACFSTLLPIGLNAHTIDQQAKSSSFLSTSSDLALATRLSDKAKNDVKAEAPREASIAGPKIGPKNPAVELKITPRESKLSAAGFETPDARAKLMNFRATAYALRGRTRSGVYVRRGIIAADPRVLPLGSVVEMKAGSWSGTYTVHDTGGRIKGKIIDVWVPSNSEARQFGRRSVKIHVLRYGPKK
jgi:3D (Asp-Asp-Asp) domain-containing protein